MRLIDGDALARELLSRTYYGCDGEYYQGLVNERNSILELIAEAKAIKIEKHFPFSLKKGTEVTVDGVKHIVCETYHMEGNSLDIDASSKGGNTMREILFKARRKDNGEWIKGQYTYDYEGKHYITQPLKGSHCLVEVDPNTVCQFTGEWFNGYNGEQRVFEGDRIYEPYLQQEFTISWTRKGWMATSKAYNIELSAVITNETRLFGNIHDKEESQ